MIQINWNNFKAKFNGKETSSFESLAYQLFCNEYGNDTGVFRFKNQTGIETEPINFEGIYIGFQAKFYETKISDNKDEIIESIEKGKRENPKLNKILFYLNQEFSESSTKKVKNPAYKKEIEKIAKKLKVEIEWRVPSHFERQLALPKNNYLNDFFFSLDKSVIDSLNEIKNHSENLLRPIQENIEYEKNRIIIDRISIINDIREEVDKSGIVIISGEGGCGKTAIIKEFYNDNKDSFPFYIFKASEFELSDIQLLFKKHHNLSLNDFTEAHNKEERKIIVIDSAEKISDLENQEPIKEFISALIKNSWSILFTTRLSYLDDLRFQFIEVFRLPFKQIGINNLTESELIKLSEEFKFQLPINERLKKITLNPFYLNEYLKNYNSIDNTINYSEFKNILWLKKIQNSSYRKQNTHINREECFLAIIKERSDSGNFFVNPSGCQPATLSLLQSDEIIDYNSANGGYFITHDIYEEWGLNKLIERTYLQSLSNKDFVSKIGLSLTIRRAFRIWLSDKLIENLDEIKSFIENVFIDKSIDQTWKDETLVSILLSDYSDEFFTQFHELIINDEYSILKKSIFFLRIACKEVDNSLYKLFGKELDLKYLFTKPKGNGWHSVIDLINKNIENFDISDLSYLTPLLEEWNSNNNKGESTKKASLFALHFYKKLQLSDEYLYTEDSGKKLVKIINQGAPELKDELSIIFDEVLENNWSNRSDPYYDLCLSILKPELEALPTLIALPDYILKLADLFWFEPPIKSGLYSSIGMEQHYSISRNSKHDYSTASALQTPINYLLKFSFKNTLDFIINFTNKTVEFYANSDYKDTIEEIEIQLTNEIKVKQYISQSLWHLYRGNGSPVTPYLLQSIHMALEKHLLDIAKKHKSEIIESWLLYLIKESKSASITSVVASVVLAYPDKLFNVAKVLFGCQKLFHYDTSRAVSEYHVKSLYSIGYGIMSENEIYADERIKTCDDPHRWNSLESLALNYQLFKNEEISDEESKNRARIIWDIIDSFHKKLPKRDEETDKDKTTRLLLARLDKRKMNISTEVQGDKILVSLNPEIDADLKKHSEEAVKESLSFMKHSGLKLWSTYKLEGDKKHEKYEEYQNDTKKILNKTKEIINGLKNGDSQFHLFNSAIPSLTCSTLIRFYSSELTKDEKEFCKETILEYATAPFQDGYNYQVSDGVEVSISSIPFLINLFPGESSKLNSLLFLVLMDNRTISHQVKFCNFAIKAFANHLWDISPLNALKILQCFLKFKPLFNIIKEEKSTRADMPYSRVRVSYQEIIKEFFKQYEKELDEAFNKDFEDIDFKVDNYSVQDLDIIFQIIPIKTEDKTLLNYVSEIVLSLSEKLIKGNRHRDRDKSRDRSQDIDSSLRYRFLKKYSYFVLYRPVSDIDRFIKPFVDNFQSSDEMKYFFEQFIWAEDKINQYEQFWLIWELFYPKIIEFGKDEGGHYYKSIIKTYLLAWNHWRKDAKNWVSLKEREKLFYKKTVRDLAENPAVLDSIAQFLNQIGSDFIEEGVFWISDLVRGNEHKKLGVNTVYYTAQLVRKYIYLNRTKVKHEIKTKTEILIILNFLISKGSVNAYLLREDIL
ncbi:AAA family ATPase [Lacinutrix sp. WUR7]|uniref:AVAST type 4 anti-phage nuclease Avs4 n=1 Tax=Lacinutrix sp. WUR7 TaxID=2653681 RepID=UPI00193E4ABC|nr:AVAST type 4 anti-phage nuclease Avs4 [Lacinutrix sp. WUR7]QRM89528.1 AAA family ATPase [Lacinutrix sp. WUR7]